MPKLTDEQWLAARKVWESDPQISIREIGRRNGVSGEAVRNMIQRQGWVKVDHLDSINRAAQMRADAEEGPLPASIEQSTDLRVKLIQAHRAEWRKHAGLFPLEAIKADFDLGKKAKISAEMIGIRQKGERTAWGMDEATDKTDVVVCWAGVE